MLFNSIHFLIFLPIVVILYFNINNKYRVPLLLVASYYFYMVWNPAFIVLVILSTCVDYCMSIQMGKTNEKQKRKKFLYTSLIFNLGLLLIFKYLGFFSLSINSIFHFVGTNYTIPSFNLILPLGISFYTFQTLGYTIDVYKGRIKPEKNFMVFALYVSFFPQLVAGPIERPSRLIPQFYEKHEFDYDRITDGMKLMTWGFFKKLVIADRISPIVSTLYMDPTKYSGPAFILAAFLFSIQIYCDFSGYTDIARGCAKILGFDLMLNFDRPFFATSTRDLWNRWHISLSSWFRDYVYIPLGGNKKRKNVNLLVTFLLSGLWHGANWTFVVWGGMNGIFLIIGNLIKKYKSKLKVKFEMPKVIKIFITFSLFTFSMIYFRANSIKDALYVSTHLFTGLGEFGASIKKLLNASLGSNGYEFVILILAILTLYIVQIIQGKGFIIDRFRTMPLVPRWCVYYVLVTATIWLAYTGSNEFIYFQF